MSKGLVKKETALTNSEETNDLILDYIRTGSVGHMNDKQRNMLIVAISKEIGISPALSPIIIIETGGVEKLYLTAGATNALAASQKLSRKIVNHHIDSNNLIASMTVKVESPEGRSEEGVAFISIGEFQGGKFQMKKGEELANTFMKLQTKAFRRATLAFVGAGHLFSNGHEDAVDYTPAATTDDTPQAVKEATKSETIIEAEVDSDEDAPEAISGKDSGTKRITKEELFSDKENKEGDKEDKKEVESKPKKTRKPRKTKEEKRQEKVEDNNKKIEENKELANEIKENYNTEEADIIEEPEVKAPKKPEPKKVRFDKTNKEHVSLMVSTITDAYQSGWSKDPDKKDAVLTKLRPKLLELDLIVQDDGRLIPTSEFNNTIADFIVNW